MKRWLQVKWVDEIRKKCEMWWIIARACWRGFHPAMDRCKWLWYNVSFIEQKKIELDSLYHRELDSIVFFNKCQYIATKAYSVIFTTWINNHFRIRWIREDFANLHYSNGTRDSINCTKPHRPHCLPCLWIYIIEIMYLPTREIYIYVPCWCIEIVLNNTIYVNVNRDSFVDNGI